MCSFLCTSSFWGRFKLFLLSLVRSACWAQLLSHVWCFATPWTAAHQALLSMGFSRQEYWRGLPFPRPEDRPDPGIGPCLLHLLLCQADSLPLTHLGSPWLGEGSVLLTSSPWCLYPPSNQNLAFSFLLFSKLQEMHILPVPFQ